MGTQAKGWWRVSLRADEFLAALAEGALEPAARSVSRFEERSGEGNGRTWSVHALFDAKPDADALGAALAEAAARAGRPPPAFDVAEVGEIDWLALNRRQFPPVWAGRFFIHGSHFEGPAPAGAVPLRVDAGPAFGSGTHETTRGCLIAIDESVRGQEVRHALDLGCGSGVLALAVAAAAGAEVLASDIDEAAVALTRSNARANGLESRIRAVLEDGVGEAVRDGAPFDLAVANILATPLMAMAGDIGKIMAPAGRLILSGLLAREEEAVLAAYGAAGFERRRSLVIGEWATLVLAPAGKP